MPHPSPLHRLFATLLGATLCVAALAAPPATGRVEVDLSGSGWTLWHDADAKWQNDTLYPPPVDVSKLPVNPPTGGWGSLSKGVPASVPGTVEEYLSKGGGPKGDVKGVSWWARKFTVPASASPRRLILRFESARLRSEVFVNRRLVGYDIVGNTPFEVDITGAARPGQACELAVRTTDPGGNFIWVDPYADTWGKYHIPASHGFGGLTGRVKLLSVDPVYLSDLTLLNKPSIKDADVLATVRNTTGAPVTRDLTVRITSKGKTGAEMFRTVKRVRLAPGETTVRIPVSVPRAYTWDLDHPFLYLCTTSLGQGKSIGDTDARTFGFRWFTEEGVGKDAVFRLNGKRIVLRSAISWGFWPINGMYPTPALAEKQVRTAKKLGLNMLNFHRCIGNPIVLDKADELGLLYYEEPGGYASYVDNKRDPFAAKLAREKLLRMVKRDRSHPSLIIVNMINETTQAPGPEVKLDMRDAHTLDPSRTITYTTGWFQKDVPEPDKLHMRPYDPKQYTQGWLDEHAAPGPEMYYDAFYKGPNEIINGTGGNLVEKATRKEIVFWGEEGAISAPDRLQLINDDLKSAPRLGWDGDVYQSWYKDFESFLDRKALRPYFPTVDALTQSMGAVPYYFQGRTIENARIQDMTDGYVINGWESEIMENYSGIVDCFRNPKGDPAVLAYYNQPLYVAVKARDKVVEAGDSTTVDFWAVNERDLKGPHTLYITASDPTGKNIFSAAVPVTLTGGDVYGQLLKEGVTIPITGPVGDTMIKASLVDANGREQAQGRDDVFSVDWKKSTVSGRGAVFERGDRVRAFIKENKGLDIPAYDNTQGPLDWLVLASPTTLTAEDAVTIPTENLTTPDGAAHGLSGAFFKGKNFEEPAGTRVDATLDFGDSVPAPSGVGPENFSARWEGKVVPPVSGTYTFVTNADDGVRLWVNGQKLVDDWRDAAPRLDQGQIALEAGKPVDVRVEFYQAGGGSTLQLRWLVPGTPTVDAERVWDRVHDGTTAIVLEGTDTWLASLAKRGAIKYDGRFDVGTIWLGGQFFVRDHPLFKELPVNQALNWPYQDIVRSGKDRYGVLTEGEELVAGAWQSTPVRLGTAVGVVPYGKGKIIFSTLDIVSNLAADDKPASVAKKLFCNYLEYAVRK